MKVVIFDLFETLITEKTKSAFQSRSPNYVKLRTTRDRVVQWWEDFGERVMTGEFSNCLAKFLHMRDEVGSPVSDRRTRRDRPGVRTVEEPGHIRSGSRECWRCWA